MRRSLSNLFFLILFLSATTLLIAQNQSSMTGVVTDVSGALLPDTTIVLSNPHTAVSFTQTTDSKGSYRFTNVPPGQGYVANFRHDGFATTEIHNLNLEVGTTRTQDAKLQAGAAQTVEVNASSATDTINTTNASVGNNISLQTLNALPVQVRDSPSALFTLQPGVTTAGGSTLVGSVTGSRVDQNQVTVDGQDVNDMATGQAFVIVGKEPVDATQEFKGTVSGFPTDSGPGGGGQFALVTKSGSNKFHGDINEYNRNAALVANSWFGNNSHLPKPNYIRNQFGGQIGGPMWKHDKAFFFVNVYDSRIVQSALVNRTVPLDNLRNGNLGYVLATDPSGNPCARTSRQTTAANCIGYYTPAQVTALDPAHIGENAAFVQLINSRYPHANNLAGGDGINTGYYSFTTPEPDNELNFVGRLDFQIGSKHRVYGIGNFNRENSTQAAPEFPQDGTIAPFIDRSYRWSVGDNWAINANMGNYASFGYVVQDYNFPRTNLNPNGTNLITFTGGTTSLMSDPWLSPVNAQGRRIPIPEFSDNFQWQLHSHSLQFGGFFKFITSADHTILDYNSAAIGLGGQVTGLNASQRPTNILANTTTQNQWDTVFAAALGRVASIGQQFNYSTNGTALPLATGDQRHYRYYQSMLYAGDTWKVTPSLTISYGVNWQYYSVPYETNGLESVAEIVNGSGAGSAVPFTFDNYFGTRVKQANTLGPNAVPLIQYVLGGKANNGPNLYAPQWNNFAPRFAFAFNPAFDRKTVFNGGIGLVYDRTIVNAVQYQQDQNSYLFQQSLTQNGSSLKTDQRLGANATYVAPAPPPGAKPPFAPFLDDADGDNTGVPGAPYGLANGGAFNTMIDTHFRTPYSLIANFGMQHEFPSGFVFKIGYAGRFGRRLLGQADANQVIDNSDPKSSQALSTAMTNATLAARACGGVASCLKNLPAQPWFENVAGPGFEGYFGAPPSAFGVANWTSFLAYEFGTLVSNGDFADTVQTVAAYGFPPPFNAGMSPQFSQDTVYTNKGFSSYNGLLITLTKNMTRGLQFQANYTWAHSIDNVSLIANQGAAGGYGFVCNAILPRQCRGSSDYDVNQIFNAYFNYQLPFGHGRQWAASTPRWVDEIIGGWELSSIFNQHTGQAWSTVSNAFVPSYSNDAQAFFNGNSNDVGAHVTKNSVGQVNVFTKGNAVASEFSGPLGFAIGPRNNLRGPGYFSMDSGLQKVFAILPDRGVNLTFRADWFNILNHPSFSTPGPAPGTNTDITNANFGVITTTASTARVGQLALRLEF